MKPYIKYGLIGVGLSTAWTLIGYLMGNDSQESMKWYGWAVIIGISVFCFRGAILEIKNAKAGFISFKEAFTASFFSALLMCLINSIFSYVYFKYINPELIPYILEKTQENMVNGGMSDEQMEIGLSWQRKIMTPFWMSFFGSLVVLIVNALIALIMAAIMKKENPDDVFSS